MPIRLPRIGPGPPRPPARAPETRNPFDDLLERPYDPSKGARPRTDFDDLLERPYQPSPRPTPVEGSPVAPSPGRPPSAFPFNPADPDAFPEEAVDLGFDSWDSVKQHAEQVAKTLRVVGERINRRSRDGSCEACIISKLLGQSNPKRWGNKVVRHRV